MAKNNILIIVLALGFIVSNGLWAYRALDVGVTLAHTGVALDYYRQALNQALSLLPVVARPGTSRGEVLTAARLTNQNTDGFEKDGYVWIGQIGLKFNREGQLISAIRAWE